MRTILLAVGLLAGWGAGVAQKTPDVYSQTDLMAMEAQLMVKADAHGLASETISKYATDYSMLAFRSQSGQAEQHEKFADFYFMVDGEATLVSGGTMMGGLTTTPGELRGVSIQDGKQTKLHKGDIVHVPANIPHQLILAKGSTLKYFIIKVQEVE